MDKRKVVILAVVIFLLIGLGTFVFANPDESLNEGYSDTNYTNDDEESESLDEDSVIADGEEGEEDNSANSSTSTIVIGNNNSSSNNNQPTEDSNNDNEILDGEDNVVEDNKDEEDSEEVNTTKEAPVVLINDVKYQGLGHNIGFIKDDLVLYLEDEDLNVTITKNDDEIDFVSGMEIAEDGIYVLSVKDEEDNETNVMFVIDKNNSDLTKTTMDVANATHFKNTDEAVVEIKDISLDKVVVENKDNGKVVTYSDEIKHGAVNISLDEEGTYMLTVYDKAGNETTYWLAVDETDPTIDFNVENGKNVNEVEEDNKVITYTNGSVSVKVFDKFLTEVTVIDKEGNKTVYKEFESESNNENKTLNLPLSENGIYTIAAKDKVGREVTKTLVIDKTLPDVRLYADNGVELNTGDFTVKTVKVVINGEESYIAELYQNGEKIDFEENKFYDNGNYELTITDFAGNSTSISFNVDKTKPAFYIDGKTQDKTNE